MADATGLQATAVEAQLAPVDALPDELLAAIFSYLTEGTLLLDVLPLVCKRWREVCQWPGAWAGVSVRACLDGGQWLRRPGKAAPAAARLLLHAPGLRTLQLYCTGRVVGRGPDMEWRDDDFVVEALRRTKVIVYHEVRFSGYAWLNAPAACRTAVARLLERSCGLLRSASLSVSSDDWLHEEIPIPDEIAGDEEKIWELLDSRRDYSHPMMDALAKMSQLRRLDLDLDIDGRESTDLPEFTYSDQVANANFSRLEILTVNQSKESLTGGQVPIAMLEHILQSAASSLRVLKMDYVSVYAPKLADSVARCSQLREMAVHASLVPAAEAAASLPHLERLSAKTTMYDFVKLRWRDTVPAFKTALKRCASLPALRRLRFTAQLMREDSDSYNSDSVRARCMKSFELFKKARPEVDARLDFCLDED